MTHYTEIKWKEQKAKQDRIIEEYLNGTDNKDVLMARLYGLGLRGDYLTAEVNQAVGRKEAK